MLFTLLLFFMKFLWLLQISFLKKHANDYISKKSLAGLMSAQPPCVLSMLPLEPYCSDSECIVFLFSEGKKSMLLNILSYNLSYKVF